MSAVADEIVASLSRDPERWRFEIITLKRDDGLSVDIIKPFDGSTRYARLADKSRGEPLFAWLDRVRIQRAFRRWQLRPLSTSERRPTPTQVDAAGTGR